MVEEGTESASQQAPFQSDLWTFESRSVGLGQLVDASWVNLHSDIGTIVILLHERGMTIHLYQCDVETGAGR